MRTSMCFTLLLALATTACGTFEVGVETSPTPPALSTSTGVPSLTPVFRPTLTPLPTAADLTPLPTPYQTPTPGAAGQVQGVWQQLTTADGFCTDYPLFIGGFFIGTGTQQICYMSGSEWTAVEVPQGTRAVAANQFPPGGGWEVATDEGHCLRAFGEWNCQTNAEGFPYADVRQIVPLGPRPVYRLPQSVVYQDQEYGLPVIIGAADAEATWLTVSGDTFGPLPPEIWVGTNGYGVVVIDVNTGTARRYTTADGLPSDTIRDVQAVACTKVCDFRDIWVATDRGVGHWNGERWAAYGVPHGLPSADVQGVVSRQQHTVWAATTAGAAYFDGTTWQSFTQSTGLPDADLTGVIFVTPDTLAFGTQGNGLLLFSITP